MAGAIIYPILSLLICCNFGDEFHHQKYVVPNGHIPYIISLTISLDGLC